MRLNRFATLTFTALSFAVCPTLNAQFGGVVVCANCASEPTAASIHVLHQLEYARQILQYGIQAQQLADAVKNTTARWPGVAKQHFSRPFTVGKRGSGWSSTRLFPGWARCRISKDLSGLSIGGWTAARARHLPKQLCPLGSDQLGHNPGNSSRRGTSGQIARD